MANSPADVEVEEASGGLAASQSDPAASHPHEVSPPGRASSPWTLDRVAAAVCGLIALRAGLAPLNDNSFFTHLATGRLILENGSVPTADPFSFVNPGEPWVVQSWLASIVYAAAEKVGGLFGIQLLVGILSASLGVLVWRLTRPAGLFVGRVAVASIGLFVGAVVWSERPQLFGLIFLAVTLIVADEGLDPRWMVPVMWLWANTHGSFVFGGAVLGLLLVGRFLDREPVRVELRATVWAVVGVLAAILNPLGLKLLLFPLGLLERSEAFSLMVEWKAPTWEPFNQKLFAAQAVLTVLALLLRYRKWRWILPVAFFAVAAVTSVRNIPQASLIMVPALAYALAGLGSIRGDQPTKIARPIIAALAVVGVLMIAVARSGPQTDEHLYPVDAVTWMHENGHLELSSRVVSRDFVGNYMHARFGPDEVRTYMDDRVDMHPIELINDYTALLNTPDADFAVILDRSEPTAVLWVAHSALGRWLGDSPDWEVVYQEVPAPDAGESDDDLWLVAVPK